MWQSGGSYDKLAEALDQECLVNCATTHCANRECPWYAHGEIMITASCSILPPLSNAHD